MAVFIAYSLWIIIWGLTGYFTVRTIILHIQKKRMDEFMRAYWHQHQLKMAARRFDKAGSDGLSDQFFNNHFGSDLA